MTEPLRPVGDGFRPWVEHGNVRGERPPRWYRRTVTRVGVAGRVGVARLAAPTRLLPGLAALGCAVAGSLLLWGVGVALLVAVPFLLALDARTPRS